MHNINSCNAQEGFKKKSGNPRLDSQTLSCTCRRVKAGKKFTGYLQIGHTTLHVRARGTGGRILPKVIID